MSTVEEIEAAIDKLPPAEQARVASWLEARRQTAKRIADFEAWIIWARGAGLPGVTTAQIMEMTRGEE